MFGRYDTSSRKNQALKRFSSQRAPAPHARRSARVCAVWGVPTTPHLRPRGVERALEGSRPRRQRRGRCPQLQQRAVGLPPAPTRQRQGHLPSWRCRMMSSPTLTKRTGQGTRQGRRRRSSSRAMQTPRHQSQHFTLRPAFCLPRALHLARSRLHSRPHTCVLSGETRRGARQCACGRGGPPRRGALRAWAAGWAARCCSRSARGVGGARHTQPRVVRGGNGRDRGTDGRRVRAVRASRRFGRVGAAAPPRRRARHFALRGW